MIMRSDRLARTRELRGLSQAELAEMVGISSGQIYRYENDKTEPDGKIVARLAQALGVSSDYLLGLTDSALPYIEAELTDSERIVLDAWRRGEKYKAIQGIVNDG